MDKVMAMSEISATVSKRSQASETLRVPLDLAAFLVDHVPARARRTIPKGGIVYRQGEQGTYLFVVLSGRVAISMFRADGQEFLIDIVGKGALCGEGAVFDEQPRFSTASAIETCEVLMISGAMLCELMAAHPKLSLLVVKTIALKQRTLASRVVQVSQASPEIRITNLLSQISNPEQRAVALTHQQIASLIGASRVTVTRALQRLQRDGTLRCERGRYELMTGVLS